LGDEFVNGHDGVTDPRYDGIGCRCYSAGQRGKDPERTEIPVSRGKV
jgi:hypothetical protein